MHDFSAKLSSLDAFTIGVHLLNGSKYYDAGFWLYYAMWQYDESLVNDAMDFSFAKICEVYKYALLQQGKYISV